MSILFRCFVILGCGFFLGASQTCFGAENFETKNSKAGNSKAGNSKVENSKTENSKTENLKTSPEIELNPLNVVGEAEAEAVVAIQDRLDQFKENADFQSWLKEHSRLSQIREILPRVIERYNQDIEKFTKETDLCFNGPPKLSDQWIHRFEKKLGKKDFADRNLEGALLSEDQRRRKPSAIMMAVLEDERDLRAVTSEVVNQLDEYIQSSESLKGDGPKMTEISEVRSKIAEFVASAFSFHKIILSENSSVSAVLLRYRDIPSQRRFLNLIRQDPDLGKTPCLMWAHKKLRKYRKTHSQDAAVKSQNWRSVSKKELEIL